MNKIKMIVLVALLAASTSCVSTENENKNKYMTDYPMSNCIFMDNGSIVSTDTTLVLNPYDIVIGYKIRTTISTMNNVYELHADGNVTVDSARVLKERYIMIKLTYLCDIEE